MHKPGLVGLYPSIDTKAHEEAHIADVMLRANDGCDFWERIMEIPDKPARDRLKVHWPVVCTPHGVFAGRLDEQPISWSGLTYHDLDSAFPDALHPVQEQWVRAIAAETYVAAVGVSMSGLGLGVLCAHQGIADAAAHAAAWTSAQSRLATRFPGNWDLKTRNPARAWFVPPLMKRAPFASLPPPPGAALQGRVVQQMPAPPQESNSPPQQQIPHATEPQFLEFDDHRTPEEWARQLGNLRRRSNQWEGPCPGCGGGHDRFYITPGATKPSLVRCRICGPWSHERWARICRIVWGEPKLTPEADAAATRIAQTHPHA